MKKNPEIFEGCFNHEAHSSSENGVCLLNFDCVGAGIVEA